MKSLEQKVDGITGLENSLAVVVVVVVGQSGVGSSALSDARLISVDKTVKEPTHTSTQFKSNELLGDFSKLFVQLNDN